MSFTAAPKHKRWRLVHEHRIRRYKRILRRYRGPVDGDLAFAKTYMDLGDALCELRKYKKASSAYNIAVVARTSVLGPDHLLVCEAHLSLARARLGAGSRDSAIRSLTRVLESRERHLTDDDPGVVEVVKLLAQLHARRTKSWPTALKLYEKLADVQGRTMSDHDHEMRNTLCAIGRLKKLVAQALVSSGDTEGAVSSYEDALRVYLRLGHTETALFLYRANAVLYSRLGKQSEAERAFELAVEIEDEIGVVYSDFSDASTMKC